MIRGCAIVSGTSGGTSGFLGYLLGLFLDFWVPISLFPYFGVSFSL